MTKITKEMQIHEILDIDPGNAAILMAAGMHCIGCPASSMESLQDACNVHGVDADDLVDTLNDYLTEKEARKGAN